MRGGFSRYIGTGPGEPRKGTLTFYLDFFIIIFFIFSTQIHNFEKSFSLSSGPKAVLFRLAKFLLEALVQSIDKSLFCNGPAGLPSGNFSPGILLWQINVSLVCLVYWSDIIISYFVYSTGQYMLCMEAVFVVRRCDSSSVIKWSKNG